MAKGQVYIDPASIDSVGSSKEWWEDSAPLTAVRIYRCVLTGEADEQNDVDLPISSFQYRLYANGRAFVSAVVPNVTEHEPLVTSRLNGDIVLYQGYRYVTGEESLTEMARAGLSNIQYSRGGRRSSLTLVGSDTVTFSFDPGVEKIIESVVVDVLQADGKRKVQTEPIFGLFPGDSFKLNDNYYKVEFISVAVGDRMSQMYVTYTDVAGTRYDLKTNTNSGIAGF